MSTEVIHLVLLTRKKQVILSTHFEQVALT